MALREATEQLRSVTDLSYVGASSTDFGDDNRVNIDHPSLPSLEFSCRVFGMAEGRYGRGRKTARTFCSSVREVMLPFLLPSLPSENVAVARTDTEW